MTPKRLAKNMPMIRYALRAPASDCTVTAVRRRIRSRITTSAVMRITQTTASITPSAAAWGRARSATTTTTAETTSTMRTNRFWWGIGREVRTARPSVKRYSTRTTSSTHSAELSA